MYAGEIVERGPSEELTQHPAHPYTQLLLAAAPDPDRLGAPVDERLLRGSRQAASALSTTTGCRFSPRCPFADERCRAESPPLRPIRRASSGGLLAARRRRTGASPAETRRKVRADEHLGRTDQSPAPSELRRRRAVSDGTCHTRALATNCIQLKER